MQIGLCLHHCQTPVAHNEVGEEPRLIFMTQRSTCSDRKHSASTWWDVNGNTAALLGRVTQKEVKLDGEWFSLWYTQPIYILPWQACISHYADIFHS